MSGPDPKAIEACRQFAEMDGWPAAKAFILFGSRARGDYTDDSDADLAIIVEGKPENSWYDLVAMSSVALKVLDRPGVWIEPILIGESEFNDPEKASNPAFLREIKKDGVIIA